MVVAFEELRTPTASCCRSFHRVTLACLAAHVALAVIWLLQLALAVHHAQIVFELLLFDILLTRIASKEASPIEET